MRLGVRGSKSWLAVACALVGVWLLCQPVFVQTCSAAPPLPPPPPLFDAHGPPPPLPPLDDAPLPVPPPAPISGTHHVPALPALPPAGPEQAPILPPESPLSAGQRVSASPVDTAVAESRSPRRAGPPVPPDPPPLPPEFGPSQDALWLSHEQALATLSNSPLSQSPPGFAAEDLQNSQGLDNEEAREEFIRALTDGGRSDLDDLLKLTRKDPRLNQSIEREKTTFNKEKIVTKVKQKVEELKSQPLQTLFSRVPGASVVTAINKVAEDSIHLRAAKRRAEASLATRDGALASLVARAELDDVRKGRRKDVASLFVNTASTAAGAFAPGIQAASAVTEQLAGATSELVVEGIGKLAGKATDKAIHKTAGEIGNRVGKRIFTPNTVTAAEGKTAIGDRVVGTGKGREIADFFRKVAHKDPKGVRHKQYEVGDRDSMHGLLTYLLPPARHNSLASETEKVQECARIAMRRLLGAADHEDLSNPQVLQPTATDLALHHLVELKESQMPGYYDKALINLGYNHYPLLRRYAQDRQGIALSKPYEVLGQRLKEAAHGLADRVRSRFASASSSSSSSSSSNPQVDDRLLADQISDYMPGNNQAISASSLYGTPEAQSGGERLNEILLERLARRALTEQSDLDSDGESEAIAEAYHQATIAQAENDEQANEQDDEHNSPRRVGESASQVSPGPHAGLLQRSASLQSSHQAVSPSSSSSLSFPRSRTHRIVLDRDNQQQEIQRPAESPRRAPPERELEEAS